MIASSRKSFDNSFSKAKVRVFPSEDIVSISLYARGRLRTNDKRQILKLSTTPLVIDRVQALSEELFRIRHSFFIDDNLE